MFKVRLDVDRGGIREVKLITNDKNQEPYEFFLKVKPVIEKFKKNLERVLGGGSKEER